MGTFPFEQTACCSRSALASLCGQLGACAIYSRCFQPACHLLWDIAATHFADQPLFALAWSLGSLRCGCLSRPRERTELLPAGVDSTRGWPGEERDAFTCKREILVVPVALGLKDSKVAFSKDRGSALGSGEDRRDALQLAHWLRRFGRDQVPASVAATESLHGGRARPCPATRSCFPATSSLTAPTGTCESPGSRSSAPGLSPPHPAHCEPLEGQVRTLRVIKGLQLCCWGAERP